MTSTSESANPCTLGTGIVGTGLSVAFDDRPVFSGVDIAVPHGSITGVIGPSGRGKTTLLRALAGLVSLTSGSVDYDGRPRPAKQSIAMLAQHPRQVCNPRWTLSRIIAEPARVRDRREVVDIDGLADRVGLAPQLLDRFPAQVSDGQLQRACLARVLVQDPEYVLCDEPTAMLDPIAARSVVALLSELAGAGVAVLLVSHHHTLVRDRCSSVLDLGAELDN
ncbi:MAG: ATP-binding cassette domain-containing protein [Gordonia sp. (in: high G+C Gram-positive bacteria)]